MPCHSDRTIKILFGLNLRNHRCVYCIGLLLDAICNLCSCSDFDMKLLCLLLEQISSCFLCSGTQKNIMNLEQKVK